MLFFCDGKGGMVITMLYNAIGEFKTDVLNWTAIYQLEFDRNELNLSNSEILQSVRSSGPQYVSTVVRVSDRIRKRFSTAPVVVGFKMLPPSGQIYAGWASDFASGRDKYFAFEKTCRR
jgi:hypothetical protein